jgi:hypothetical protein
LAPDKISATKDKFHLIQNEVNFLNCLERAVGFNLDLLYHLGSIIVLAISFKHFSVLTSDLRVLSFQEHLAFTGLSEGIKHLVSLLTAWKLVKNGITHAPLYHISYCLFGLASTLDQHEHEFTEARKIVIIKGQPQL